MHSPDPLVSLKLATPVAEVGDSFYLSVSRSPADGAMNESSIGKVRSLRVELEYTTEGRGDEDSKIVHSSEISIDRFGMGSADLRIEIPSNAPISYDGELIRVRYQIHVRTDVQASIDRATDIPVLVVPTGGATTYRKPHPLPPEWNALT